MAGLYLKPLGMATSIHVDPAGDLAQVVEPVLDAAIPDDDHPQSGDVVLQRLAGRPGGGS